MDKFGITYANGRQTVIARYALSTYDSHGRPDYQIVDRKIVASEMASFLVSCLTVRWVDWNDIAGTPNFQEVA